MQLELTLWHCQYLYDNHVRPCLLREPLIWISTIGPFECSQTFHQHPFSKFETQPVYFQIQKVPVIYP